MSGLLSRQVLAPIDYKAFGVADSKALASNYISGVLSGYTLSKQVYGVPEEFSNYGNWVNVKAFKEAGLEVPKTWDEVCKDGPKMLKTSNGKVVQQEIVLPTNLSASQVFVLDAIAHEYGSSLFSTDGKHSNLKAPGVQQAVSMLQDLVYKCKASVPTLNSGTQGADRIVYGSGQAAMLLTGGSWYLGSLQQQYPKVAPPASAAYQYPTVPGHAPSSTGYGYAWVVPKASKNQALAWQLVKALSDAGDKFFDQMGLFNGTNSVATSPAATKQQFWTSTWKPSLSNSNYAVGLTNSGQVYDIIGNAFTDVILHHADVKSALAQADQQIEPLLNK
jgi:ABC-type glycerol-3-phosphate transport system substrate-binding protein